MRLIDADALEDVLVNDGFRYCGTNKYLNGIARGFLLAIDDVREAPTIEAEPTRHGEWIKVGDNSYKCSRCNEISCCEGNFCVDCGAKMDE